MTRTASEAFGWLRRQALSYFLIVAVLAGGTYLTIEYRSAKAGELALVAIRSDVQRLELQAKQAANLIPSLRDRMQQKLGRIQAVHERAQVTQREKELERARYALDHRFKSLIPGSDPYLHLKALDAELVALRGVTATAQGTRVVAENVFRSAEAIREYEREATGKRSQAQLLRAQWAQLHAQSGWKSGLIFTTSHKDLNRLKGEIERLDYEASIAQKRIESLRSAAATDRDLAALMKQLADVSRARAAIDSKRAHLADAVVRYEASPYREVEKFVIGVLENFKPYLLTAAGILALVILGRIFIKLLLYYFVAPLASRRSAIRLLPEGPGAAPAGAAAVAREGDRVSAVSIPIRLRAGQELLVLPEYLQSTSQRAIKRTKWVLNHSIPWSSLLSGMFMLTRVRSAEEDEVVISATKDPLSEVCLIDLPEGAAFICQPRSLAGVVQNRDRPIRITRHWRVGSLHAWLTFQLRFLVFHGPGQLIVKGCRGVRMERAGRGRLINQAATLGFDASVDYANTRCETFVSYLSGKDNLFNDLFTGGNGSYLYEEMPDLKHKSGFNGRGISGLFDAGLKVFGV